MIRTFPNFRGTNSSCKARYTVENAAALKLGETESYEMWIA